MGILGWYDRRVENKAAGASDFGIVIGGRLSDVIARPLVVWKKRLLAGRRLSNRRWVFCISYPTILLKVPVTLYPGQ